MSTPRVLVSGAGQGIGAAVAHRIVQDGQAVVCIDIDGAAAERTAHQLRAAGGVADSVRADVSIDADCQQLIAQLPADTVIAGLCNIAGICPYGTSISSTSEETWDRVLAVNLKSIFLLSRACLPLMTDREGGATIINTTSVHAYASHPESAPYAASKGAIISLTRQMAIDLAPQSIRVVAVAPGAIDTPMSHAGAAALGTGLGELGFPSDPTAIGRLGQASEVAEVYAWLLSAEARYVNGTTILADGGLLTQLPGARP